LGKSDGTNQTLWMDPLKTSAFDLYQFFVNVSDDEVEGLLKKLTFLPLETIDFELQAHRDDTE